ncbi:tRNA preQ1(34) S-adenosylmethionine ribosyltransferase-isomerase QueA [Heliorestis acidaminivorans]|uniref:S-adenosylmethionine:tRNA ribosyltransferase-isomerase n=1 Tax=Heliorestis acidaminivorans TaxID=553427 RepID=A0A6I0ERF2_9FIRM|nr:tRNA preQ1(34) S-adenosylmethionine ribosyltransferase-isomerase QueA [Heliorestis acidaminivorans]KAB2951256.1 tRNA preQ1(34) S-adenosylmethionine ribosyltransferase-isomerase QueA [Heliorestis acidaminivorans]
MKVDSFDYELPHEAIAQEPIEPRDASKLMVIDRQNNKREHRIFRELGDYLQPGDLLVLNRTRVIPARLYGTKSGTETAVEMVLLTPKGNDQWEVLVRPGRRLKPGTTVEFGEQLKAEILDSTAFGGRLVRFYYQGNFEEILDELGQMPLPPYIERPLQKEEAERYQTVYSQEKGSAAAPTAGLHFTPQLLEKLQEKGVEIATVLLHVGLGTFRPVQVEEIEDHQMHAEFYQIDEQAVQAIKKARQEGRRVIAVGTTVVRTLESVATFEGEIKATSGWTNIFIYPGYQFKVIDGLITNFHLPRSTLLMLVSAFTDRDTIIAAYEEALEKKYRFFSFGDAMMIL